ncbi:fungal-specific transcription factor domain protein [Cadophora sp. MPI-SDFR-AT-0126]|nr:fungal-specific transcription factor domain protein [Leotiomycetes sp. MPI-SDFR-AT-0126]
MASSSPEQSGTSPVFENTVGASIKRKLVDVSGSDTYPTTSLDTNAAITGHKRRKVTRACDSCKQRRVRCSGTLPCARCSDLSLNCQFMTSYRRGPPPSPKSISIEYVSSPALSTGSATQQQPSSARNSPERGATDFGGHYLGPSSGITFLNRAWRRMNQDFVANIPYHLRDEPLQSSIFNYGDAPFAPYHPNKFTLPSRQQASSLAAIYFDKAIVTYRFLHRGSVELWLDEIYHTGRSLWDNPPKSQSLISKAAVVFMIFAVVMLHEEKSQEWNTEVFDVVQSEHWFGAAQHMMSMQTGPPRLEMIQARMVQCLYLISSSRANQCLHTLGDVMYLVLATGLHRKRPKPVANISYIEQECQKRIFWSVYMLERYLCVMLGRPKTLHDEDIDQIFPDEINDEDMTAEGPIEGRRSKDCVITASILHFRLACIVGEMSREIHSILPISEEQRLEASERITLSLEAWKSQLPPIFSIVDAASLVVPFHRQSHILRTAYAHAVIHATRSFLLVNHSDLVKQSTISIDNVLKHVLKCIDAAQILVDMVNDNADGSLSQAFWFTHYTSFCAVVVIYVYTIQHCKIFYRYPSMPASSDLLAVAERCQRSLADASRKHCPSQRYSIILEELRHEVYRQISYPPQGNFDNGTLVDGNDLILFTAANPSEGDTTSFPTNQVSSTYNRGPDDIRVSNSDGLTPGLMSNQNWNWNSTEWLHLDSLAYMQLTDPMAASLDFM